MSELRVPTLSLPAQIVCADGRSFSGQVFVTIGSARHAGPMRPEEWMNEPSPFFPFAPDSGEAAFLLNKREVLILTLPAQVEVQEEESGVELAAHHVVIECEDRRLEGTVLIDMPENRSRLVDYLNRAAPFLTLRDGDRHHLVQKERITRVAETREG